MKTVACIAVAAAPFITLPAQGEIFASVYGGMVNTEDSDLHYKQGSTDVTFHDVKWDDESFKGSLYGGYRLGYWFDHAPHWGISAEWIHAKMVADLNQNVSVTGTRGGLPVNTTEPLGNSFDNLQFTHGHNFGLLNVHYRWFLTEPESDSFLSRLEPYVGLGAGFAWPHVEVDTVSPTTSTAEYQLPAGFACQGFAGVSLRLAKYVSIFTEAKLTYAQLDVDLPGGSLETEPFSEHIVVGLSINFGKSR
jgi:lipid A oxidase